MFLAFHSWLVMRESLETRPKQSKTANFAHVVRFLQAAGFDEQKEGEEERRSDAAENQQILCRRDDGSSYGWACFNFFQVLSVQPGNPPGMSQESLCFFLCNVHLAGKLTSVMEVWTVLCVWSPRSRCSSQRTRIPPEGNWRDQWDSQCRLARPCHWFNMVQHSTHFNIIALSMGLVQYRFGPVWAPWELPQRWIWLPTKCNNSCGWPWTSRDEQSGSSRPRVFSDVAASQHFITIVLQCCFIYVVLYHRSLNLRRGIH